MVDIYFRCLSESGVAVADTRDFTGAARFLEYSPESHLNPGDVPWEASFWKHSMYLSPEVSCDIPGYHHNSLGS